MITLGFSISNPWAKRFESVKHYHGKTWIPNKFWEINVYKINEIIGFHFDLSFRQDHAGLAISFYLLGYSLCFDYYDNRHWDDDRNFWVED